MIEIILWIISIILAILLFFLGIHFGKQHNNKIVRELEKQNGKLNKKINKLNRQNKDFLGKINDLEIQNNEQKEMLEKSYQALGGLKQQNDGLSIKIGNLENQMKIRKTVSTSNNMQPNFKPVFNELLAYGIKQWGKDAIDDWFGEDD